MHLLESLFFVILSILHFILPSLLVAIFKNLFFLKTFSFHYYFILVKYHKLKRNFIVKAALDLFIIKPVFPVVASGLIK